MSGTKTVGSEFPVEQARVRELIATYRALPGNVGVLGAAILEEVLRKADQAAMSGDIVAILRSYEEMKGCE